MASSSDLDKQVSDILTCSLCLDILNKPRTLQCLHSYCEHCLSQMKMVLNENVEGYDCPQCRAFTALSNIRTAHVIVQLLDAYNAANGVNKERKCDTCKTDTADWLCSECKQDYFLCDKCKENHDKFLSRIDVKHDILSAKEIMGSSRVLGRPLYCDTHREYKLEVFCQNCEKVICILCKVSEHNFHQSVPISSGLHIILPKLEKSLQQLEADVNSREEYIQKNKEELYKILNIFSNAKSKACKLEDDIRKIKEALAKKIDEINIKYELEKDKFINTIENEQEKLNKDRYLISWIKATMSRTAGVRLLAEFQLGLSSKLMARLGDIFTREQRTSVSVQTASAQCASEQTESEQCARTQSANEQCADVQFSNEQYISALTHEQCPSERAQSGQSAITQLQNEQCASAQIVKLCASKQYAGALDTSEQSANPQCASKETVKTRCTSEKNESEQCASTYSANEQCSSVQNANEQLLRAQFNEQCAFEQSASAQFVSEKSESQQCPGTQSAYEDCASVQYANEQYSSTQTKEQCASKQSKSEQCASEQSKSEQCASEQCTRAQNSSNTCTDAHTVSAEFSSEQATSDQQRTCEQYKFNVNRNYPFQFKYENYKLQETINICGGSHFQHLRISIIWGQLFLPNHTTHQLVTYSLENMHTDVIQLDVRIRSPRAVVGLDEENAALASDTGLFIINRQAKVLQHFRNAVYVDIFITSTENGKAVELACLDNFAGKVDYFKRIKSSWAKAKSVKLVEYKHDNKHELEHARNQFVILEDTIIVSFVGSNTIVEYDLDGKPFSDIANKGLLKPGICAVDSDSNLLVCSPLTSKIEILDKDGDVTLLLQTRPYPWYVVFENRNALWIVYHDNIIRKFEISDLSFNK